MPDVDAFTRSYLFVDVHRPASADAVAELLEAAAATLRQYGELDVHHIAFEPAHDTQSTTSLTVYYDRIERRRHPRLPGEARHLSHASRSDAGGPHDGGTPGTRPDLRPVD